MCLLCAAMFVSGIFVSSTDAASRPVQNVTQPGVNFNFMNNPRMIASCADYVYVVEVQFTQTHLHIIRRDGASTHARIYMPTTPIDIIYTNNNLFIFFSMGFRAYRTETLRAIGFTTFQANPTLIAYTNTNEPMSVFNVRPIPQTNNVQILFAHSTRHGTRQVLVTSTAVTPLAASTSVATNRTIMGIGATANGTVYLLASSPNNHTMFSVQTANNDTPLSSEYVNTIQSVMSFNILESGGSTNFIFIASDRIVLFNLQEEYTAYITPHTYDNFLTRKSYRPIYIRARSATEIFVVDQQKRSIDQYRLIATHRLEFYRTVAGSIGDDYGFFNHPTAISLIEEGLFWISDYSHSIRRQNTLTTTMPSPIVMYDENVSVIRTMAFNNQDRIYTVDRDRRLQRFNLEGNPVGNVIDLPNQAQLVEIVPNITTGEMFALDNGRNTIFLIGETELTSVLSITLNPNSRAIINPWIRNNDTMLVTNTNSGHVIVCLQANVVINNLNAALNYTGHVLRDITMDTLGNIIVLYENSTTNLAVVRHLTLTLTGTTVTATQIGDTTTITNSSISLNNPSLMFDRLNNKLLWIGRFHAVESVDLQDVLALWSFRENFTTRENRRHYDWQDVTPIPIPTNPMFARIKDSYSPFMYEFPQSLTPIRRLSTGFEFQILQSESTFEVHDFDYSFILFQNRTTGNHYAGYVNNRFVEFLTGYYITTDVFGNDGAPNPDNIGRVVLNGVPIFKYPTSLVLDPESTVFDMTVGVLNMTPRHGPGIRINRRIEIQDIRGWEFFEIRIDSNGAPRLDGDYVGYVFVQHMINFNLPQSSENFIPNARAILPTNRQPTGIQVFNDAGGQVAIYGEFIGHRQEIQVLGGFDRNRPFTHIRYFCETSGTVKYGFIQTIPYIVMDGFTALQLMGIILAIVGTIGAVIFAAWHFRRKRNQG